MNSKMNENMPERTKRALDCERRNHFWNQAMSLLLAKATKKCPMAQQRETKPHAWSYCTCYQSLISFVFFFSVRSEKRAPYVRLLLLDMNGQAHHKRWCGDVVICCEFETFSNTCHNSSTPGACQGDPTRSAFLSNDEPPAKQSGRQAVSWNYWILKFSTNKKETIWTLGYLNIYIND